MKAEQNNGILENSKSCLICLKPYDAKRRPVKYHISYDPEKIITACNMCNHFEYLARKHPAKVLNYGKKFRKRLKRIQELSPQYQYQFRQKFPKIILDRFGNEIKREIEYRLVNIREAPITKRRTKHFVQRFNISSKKRVKLDLCKKCKLIMVMTQGLYGNPLMRCPNYPRCRFYKVVRI